MRIWIFASKTILPQPKICLLVWSHHDKGDGFSQDLSRRSVLSEAEIVSSSVSLTAQCCFAGDAKVGRTWLWDLLERDDEVVANNLLCADRRERQLPKPLSCRPRGRST